jgi:EAL domain-containing protein (putative c-di-GMP-specific phosphodiesterase class I)
MASMGSRAGVRPRDDAVALIRQVLAERAIFPVYQPIVDLVTRAVVGAEALARGPAGSLVEFPDALFAAANRAGLMPVLDQLCAARALEVALAAPDVVPPLVFINAEPAALSRPLSADLLAAINSPRQFRVVLEFTERALGANPAALLHIAHQVHLTGGALALDDVGAEPLSMAFLPLIEPDVVKLDMQLLRDPYSAGTIETAALASGYAERTGAVVLAEGIETEPDLVNAQALGARWGQGWLFARPGPLSLLAGWPVHDYARLRPARPDLHLPAGTPFSMAAVQYHSRTGDQRIVDGLTGHLLRQAACAGSNAVVLGGYPDQATGLSWLPRLASLADTAAFVGIVGPALTGGDPHPVRVAPAPLDGPAADETVLAVVGPYANIALCVRRGSGDEVDFVLTHDRDLVQAVARMLLRRLDAAADRPGLAVADRSPNRTTVAR